MRLPLRGAQGKLSWRRTLSTTASHLRQVPRAKDKRYALHRMENPNEWGLLLSGPTITGHQRQAELCRLGKELNTGLLFTQMRSVPRGRSRDLSGALFCWLQGCRRVEEAQREKPAVPSPSERG